MKARTRQRGALLVLRIMFLALANPAGAGAWGPRVAKMEFLVWILLPSSTIVSCGWSSIILSNVSKWNAVTGASQPKWSNVIPKATCKIPMSLANVGGCGSSNRVWTGLYLTAADVKFNSGSWFWVQPNAANGCNLNWTTLHEFMHANGNEHSPVPNTVMWPYDNARTSYASDDIGGIRANYPL